MKNWDADQYLRFKEQRTQPVRDLIARLQGFTPNTILDIGCGPGNSTKELRDAFPQAALTGMDNSPDMLEKARETYPDILFTEGDARAIDGNYDLLFSNACLQWVPNHQTLLPSLMEHVSDGGALAVQIPMNGGEPFFRLIDETVKEPQWSFHEEGALRHRVMTDQARRFYYDILSSCAKSVDLWEIHYLHVMPDHQSLLEFVKGTQLRPLLKQLDEETAKRFENTLLEKARAEYPLTQDGHVLFGFLRMFFVCKK